MITPQDESLLRRALRLAMNGRGHVEPNPMVGCVLVKNGTIIGEGWHEKFGGPHAEPNALDACKARGNDPSGATAYVTLEPCCHDNKKTPPCVPRLIETKVSRVAIGCLDPNPEVNGRGVAMLRAAGIEVDVLRGTGFQPVSANAIQSRGKNPCQKLNGSDFQQLIAPFIQALTRNGLLAYVTAKWAESADGFIAGLNRERVHLTNPTSDRQVHLLRSRCGAIAVGVGTVLADNPSLTVRGVPPLRRPLRVILDRQLRTPLDSELARTATQMPTLILCSREAWKHSQSRSALEQRGLLIKFVSGDDGEAKSLSHDESYPSFLAPSDVLVEPGPTLATSLLPWVPRLWIFRSPQRLGNGVTSASIPRHFTATGTLDLAGDTLTEYLNTKSPAFFAAVPSADFVLAQESASSVT